MVSPQKSKKKNKNKKQCSGYSAVMLEIEDILGYKFTAIEIVLDHRRLFLYLECNKKKSAITTDFLNISFKKQ